MYFLIVWKQKASDITEIFFYAAWENMIDL